MPNIAIQNQKTVGQLIEECYGKLPTTQLNALEAATFAANPHLGGSVALQPGMLIVVPPLSVAAPVPGDAVKAISAALSDYQEKLEQKIESRQTELTNTAKILASEPFQKAAAPIQSATELIKAVTEATQSGQVELDGARVLIKEIEVLKSKLDNLSGKLL